MAEKKQTNKEMEGKLKDLKIELLKNPTKRKGVKKEIARLLTTMKKDKQATKLYDSSKQSKDSSTKIQTKLEDTK